MTEEDIASHIANQSRITLIEKFPCHTQAVERIIKEVTDALLKVCGYEAHGGYIRSRLESRAKIPSSDNKACFKA